jgi:hypothetical protein
MRLQPALLAATHAVFCLLLLLRFAQLTPLPLLGPALPCRSWPLPP